MARQSHRTPRGNSIGINVDLDSFLKPRYKIHGLLVAVLSPIAVIYTSYIQRITGKRMYPNGFPHMAQFFLRLLAQKEDREVIERDIEEQFEEDVQDPHVGLNRAKMLYRRRAVKNILWSLWDRYPKRLLQLAGLMQRK